MSSDKLPTTLWGAINRAKIDIRKYHLEQNPKKKELLKLKAVASMENADKVVGPGPHKYNSARQHWRNEVLYLNSYDDHCAAIGRYWQDNQVHWSLEKLPSWAAGKDLKVQEPEVGYSTFVQGREVYYGVRPQHQDR
jgi:hypothetical protein